MKFLGPNVDKDNIMLLDVLYHNGNKDTEYTDYIDIIYKNTKSGEKLLKTIEKPEIEIYFTKEEYRDYDYNKTFMELDKTEKHTVPYKSLPWYIAKQAGEQYVSQLKNYIELGKYRDISKIHAYPYVFGSDCPIDAFYRVNWLLEYDNEAEKKVTKQFLDIEVDTIDIEGFPRDGECPINAVTIVDEEGMACYTFLLNNPNNPLIKEFIDDIDSFIDELHDMFDESYGVLDYQIYMYDDERDLIISTFRLINTLKRDFMLIWNGGGFDIPYMIERIKVLGLKPEDVMCHSDFPVKRCRFIKDTKNFAVANKGDCLKLSSYTKYIDQMILYAATRKGQSELRSHSLNFIAQHELNDDKLNYDDEANIKTLPYKNYRKFVAYNIKDVLLQFGIERKTNDVDGLYLRSYSNATDYDKIFKQTVMLKCRAYYEFLLQGYIIGNNINVFIPNDGETFAGAIVGDPMLNSHTGISIFGKKSMFVYDNVTDMDFSAMYPHIIIAFNIERNTMIGKLIIPGFEEDRYEHFYITSNTAIQTEDDEEEDDENDSLSSTYDAGKDYVDNMLCGDVISLGTKWHNLPDFETLYMEFRKQYNIKPKDRFSLSRITKKFIEAIKIDI